MPVVPGTVLCSLRSQDSKDPRRVKMLGHNISKAPVGTAPAKSAKCFRCVHSRRGEIGNYLEVVCRPSLSSDFLLLCRQMMIDSFQ